MQNVSEFKFMSFRPYCTSKQLKMVKKHEKFRFFKFQFSIFRPNRPNIDQNVVEGCHLRQSPAKNVFGEKKQKQKIFKSKSRPPPKKKKSSF